MTIFGDNPFGPRALARSYATHQRPEDRAEIERRIAQHAGGGATGAGAVQVWDEADRRRAAGNLTEEEFVERTVNMMGHSEERDDLPELPDGVGRDPFYGN